MDPSLKLVVERFQGISEHTLRLFDRDESFRDLCEDYEACVQAIDRLGSAGASPAGLRNEYTALLMRLERELLRYVEEHPDL